MGERWSKPIVALAMLAYGLAVIPAVIRADDVEQDKAIAAIKAIGGKVERIEGGIKVDLRDYPEKNVRCGNDLRKLIF